jgi:tRNA pseudouridine32 synthase / 23S rRNA pseudouridine746 synthase
MTAAIVTEFHTVPVLFENDDLIAVDKPERLSSIPERNPAKVSLLKLLADARKQKLYVVHRLDKQVSGVILFAKNAETHRYLNQLFEQRRIQKTYLALVHGVIGQGSAVIAAPLRRFGSGRMGVDQQKGKPCVTEFKVERRFPDYTLVKAYPLTGRKHQIRAHFFNIGHAIVGDTLYGDRSLQKRYPRLMLHALTLRFRSPAQDDIMIESAIPPVFP